MKKNPLEIEPEICSLRRRFGAILYDTLLLVAVLLFAAALALIFTGGEAVSSDNYYYKLYLLLVCLLYFAVSWVKGGHTLGMLAWKIKVLKQASDQSNVSLEDKAFEKITWWQATKRFFLAIISWACLGLGFIWALFSKERFCWHDKFSGTRLVYFKPIKDKS